MEKSGVLLKVDFKSQQVNLSGDWYAMNKTLKFPSNLQGKSVRLIMNDENCVTNYHVQQTKEIEVKGKIQSLNLNIPRLSMHYQGALTHFYITPSQYAQIKANFKPGEYIQFTYNQDAVQLKHSNYYVMTHVILEKEQSTLKVHPHSKLKKEVVQQLEQIQQADYYAFLDLEFTMSGSEFRGIKFIPEILQFGLMITTKDGTVVEKFSSYVKPTKFKTLSGLTQDFLKIDNERIQYAMTYQSFYECMKAVLNQYNPIFLVWGVSDAYILQSSYLINEVPPLLESTQLLDLQRTHRLYYQISQDIGLFNALKAYGMDEGPQIHDAIVDALVLSRIFFKFKSVVQSQTPYEFKDKYLALVKGKETDK